MEPNIKQSSRWLIGILNIISLIVSLPILLFIKSIINNPSSSSFSSILLLFWVAIIFLMAILIVMSQHRRDNRLAVIAIGLPILSFIGFILFFINLAYFAL